MYIRIYGYTDIRICIYGFRSKSADPYTCLTFALLSKHFLTSQAFKGFLSWSGSSSGHVETANLEVWEMGQFLHWLSIRCSVTSSRLAPSLDRFESPYIYTLLHSLSIIFFNTELLKFCDSRGNFGDNVAARKLLSGSFDWMKAQTLLDTVSNSNKTV